MIPHINAGAQQFVNTVDDLQAGLNRAQTELASGLKVNTASDAPDQVSPILQLHANIQHNQQIQQNLTQVKAEVVTADQNLSSASSLLDQVQTILMQGTSLNQTAETRTVLGNQIGDLMQQMVSISQTALSGRYIFSGDNDQTPVYTYDGTSPTGVSGQPVPDTTRQIEDASRGTFPVSRTASQIFDARDPVSGQPTDSNVFAAMNSVRLALLANDTTRLKTASGSVKSASDYLNQQQMFYGGVENRISNALDTATNADLSYRQELSTRQDADQTSAILEMQQYTINLQAAMSSQSKMPQTTLFDLLS